ncbi:hypothetical protein HDU87_005659 [Geranomyces variabilis]|uniref:Uncharacterized protein n=1 Tax=Geranomyces variabilis TaxID=109894 RepID=A0AAD5TGF8_9FUNG|nr:hypothetical protein HDU87_005659 [Geranomyces variabilis]
MAVTAIYHDEHRPQNLSTGKVTATYFTTLYTDGSLALKAVLTTVNANAPFPTTEQTLATSFDDVIDRRNSTMHFSDRKDLETKAVDVARGLLTRHPALRQACIRFGKPARIGRAAALVDLANVRGFDPEDEDKNEELAASLAYADNIINTIYDQKRRHAYRCRKIRTMIDRNGVHVYVAAPVRPEEQAIILQAQLNAANTAVATALTEREVAVAELELAKQRINKLEGSSQALVHPARSGLRQQYHL